MEIALEWVRDPAQVSLALRVREEVFCREQGVARELELDGRDADAEHMLAREVCGGQAVGTLRLLIAGPQARIGRVAVERSWRGRGIASRMLALAVDRALERGCEEARLAAQLSATGLYRRAGFRVRSEPFEQAGIQHVWMARALGG